LIRRLASVALLAVVAAGAGAADYARLPGGDLRSVLPPDGKSADAKVAPFALRTLPVTNGEFRQFLAAHPSGAATGWPACSPIRAISRAGTPPTRPATPAPTSPVTQVSWFAAEAYCESEHARLPTWHEWEFAAAADETRPDARDDPAWRERILSGTRTHRDRAAARGPHAEELLRRVRHARRGLGMGRGLRGLMISADNRNQGDPDLLKFCGAGALSTAGPRELRRC
jgi:formylglycine-generating enzyme required for sulfatase activity